ncbi:MAG: DUF72 domain-containing protein [Polyangiales bacterium]
MSDREDHPPQLTLFVGDDPMRAVYDDAARLAARLPEGLHLGASSWSFPGWKGLVYPEAKSEQWLAREGLRIYARHPLLRAVGVDRSYYAPISDDDLARLAAQLPEGFPCCFKAPASVTSAIVPGDLKRAARPNPDYLSVERFERDLGLGLLDHFRGHVGAVMLEIPRVDRAHTPRSEDFCARLGDFLSAAPRGLSYAVELREATLFTPRYLKTLRAHGASHVFNWWTAMPSLPDQSRAIAPEEMPQVIVRVMLPPGGRYDERKRDLAPFDRVREPFPEMRRDVVALARRALSAGRQTFVLVSNKAEGCAPETVRALAEMMA